MIMIGHIFVLSTVLFQRQNIDIESTLKSFTKAELSYDVPALDKLVDKDYFEVSPLGELDHHDAFLSFYNPPKENQPNPPQFMEIGELEIRHPSRDVAVAVFVERLRVGTGRNSREVAMRVTSTLKKDRRRWIVYSNQYTGIRSKSK